MDSSIDSQNTSLILSRKRKADEEDSVNVIPSKRAKFCETYRRQLFAFPDSIMHYIAKNSSSSKVYEKLVQTCKYFFIKNPVLLMSDLFYDSRNGWQATFNAKRTNIDLDKVTSRLWIINELNISFPYSNHNLLSTILPKVDQFQAKTLTLHYQHLSYNELIALGSKAELVNFDEVIVKYEDGSIVPFEKIFEAFPCVKSILFFSNLPSVSMITAKTFTVLLKVPHFSTLDYCMLQNISGDFDIESFYVYMKKNKRTRFRLYFSNSISPAYSTRLEEIVDEILDAEAHEYKPPFACFPEIDLTKLFKLHSLSIQR